MKLIIMFITVIISMIMFTSCGCEKIDPGYVGIKIQNSGSDKGISDTPLQTGWVMYNKFTEDVYEFPIFMITKVWTKSITEGSVTDDSITFNSVEGAIINADISISFQFIKEKIPSVFSEFRKDYENITDTYVRSQVRESISKFASMYKATDIFGSKKQELLEKVKIDLNTRLNVKGFKFDTVTFIGGLRADGNVIGSINAVISATQKAIEAENKVKQSEAEANQRIASARGYAEEKRLIAEGEAKANELLTKSITPQLIQWETVKKWNGVLPQSTSGTPLLQLK
jgi:regulator of protease activity HflC (stomatin/prohibitin superfamily)